MKPIYPAVSAASARERANFSRGRNLLSPPVYGRRGGMRGVDRGIRSVARGFGKSPVLTHSDKAGGSIALESEAERLVAHMLNLDPNVISYRPQPFSVELITGSIARTGEDKSQLRARVNRLGSSAAFYTPDFGLQWASGVRAALEVKLEKYPGDAEYQRKLQVAKRVLGSHGMEFLQVVIPSCWRHPLRVNLPLMNVARKRHDLWPGAEVSSRIEALKDEGATTMGDYLRGLDLDARMSPMLLVSGSLQADLVTHSLSWATPVSPAFGDLSHLMLMRRLAK
jgi:hypothetical protein